MLSVTKVSNRVVCKHKSENVVVIGKVESIHSAWISLAVYLPSEFDYSNTHDGDNTDAKYRTAF